MHRCRHPYTGCFIKKPEKSPKKMQFFFIFMHYHDIQFITSKLMHRTLNVNSSAYAVFLAPATGTPLSTAGKVHNNLVISWKLIAKLFCA